MRVSKMDNKENIESTTPPIPVSHSIREFVKESKVKTLTIPANITSPLTIPEQPTKLIVVTNVHHRDSDGKTKTHTTRFARNLDSKDDSIQRKILVGEQWIEIDSAWIKSIGYISFRNDGGKPFQVVPTDEQLKEAQGRIIEIAMIHKVELDDVDSRYPLRPMWYIKPSEDMQGKPSNDYKFYVRCQRGETSLSIFIVPN